MENNWGYFPTGGQVSTDWDIGYPGRDMRITAPITYVDRHSKSWIVPRYSVTNGASTGWFWRRLCPAYVGFYRRAAVIHDVACEDRLEPSWQVHRMFYEVSRHDIIIMARGIKSRWKQFMWTRLSVALVWVMWAVVRALGPRFPGEKKDQ